MLLLAECDSCSLGRKIYWLKGRVFSAFPLGGHTMIVITSDQASSLIIQAKSTKTPISLQFEEKDEGDVYRPLFGSHASISVLAQFYLIEGEKELETIIVTADPTARIIVTAKQVSASGEPLLSSNTVSIGDRTYHLAAYRKDSHPASFTQEVFTLVPVRQQLFSRMQGIFETDVLAKKKVMIVGLGSGGSPIALELVKSGVQHFVLVDHDRLEIGNIARHVCGLSDLGRFKTLAVKDLLLDKNPYAQVRTLQVSAAWQNRDTFERLIQDIDIVICATDNRESRLFLNRLCVESNKVCLYGGAFRRAYGGQVIRVVPHVSICYQCFLDILPAERTMDEEISNEDQARAVQYSPNDPTVPIEPGLSSDIAPISLLISKLAIIELLKNEATTLTSLYEDFIASWYLWLNRREPKTGYQNLEPLAYKLDGMRIMRWYGIRLERNPGCPACGEFLAGTDLEVTQADLEMFKEN
jgi:molybdopterin/thiamine biosynthesis adenylyltransferase